MSSLIAAVGAVLLVALTPPAWGAPAKEPAQPAPLTVSITFDGGFKGQDLAAAILKKHQWQARST